MIKAKGAANTGDSERPGRRRSVPAALKNYDLKKPSERVVTRNLRRSIDGETSGSSSTVVKRKRNSLTPTSKGLSAKKPCVTKGQGKTKDGHKRQLSNSIQRRRKRIRVLSDDDDDSIEDKTVRKKRRTFSIGKPSKSTEVGDHSSDNSDDKRSVSVPGINSKLVVRNPFLMRKLKRESDNAKTPQKYETERTDYIIEDRPSFIENSKPVGYVCHDSGENSPKSVCEAEKSFSDVDEDAETQTSATGKQSRTKGELSHRSSINFQVGGRLEARDYLNMWYPSRIIQVALENREILIHFERWNSRFDEWVSMDSPRLRPITRTSSRKDNRGRRSSAPKNFKIGEVVYAKWTDCKMYPAKILKINSDETYTVLFYDGFERDVQFINVRKLPPELVGKVNFKPGAFMKVQEDKLRKVSGPKTADVNIEPEATLELDSSNFESQTDCNEVNTRDECELNSSKVTPGIASNKRNKLLVGGIFQAKRQQLKVKIGGDGVSKSKKQFSEKSSSGRTSPIVGPKTDENIADKESTPVVEDKTKGSITSPLLVQELSKAPLFEFGGPTKAFLIEEDHNHFKCTVAGCGKSFRKDVLLASHMKHYHTTPKATAPVKKSVSSNEIKDEISIDSIKVLQERNSEISAIDFCTPTTSLEGNLERKLITEKRRQLLMQRKLDSMTKKKDQHISDVIASVAKKFNPASPEKPEILIKENSSLVVPKTEKPKPSPKKRKYFFTTKVMSKFRRMKMMANDKAGKLNNDDGPQEELINCCCERPEEDGLMMQCEVCLAWQHGPCFGIEDEKRVPDRYICHICKNPKGLRTSYRYCYNHDWFKTGEMATFKFLPLKNNWNLKNNIYKTHGLAAQTLIANDVLHSLRSKLQMAKSSSHPDLKKWSLPWAKKNVVSSLVDKLDGEVGGEKSMNGMWDGFSDHCYSVPNQEFSNDSLVDENGLFFNDNSKGLCFDVAANEDVDGTTESDAAVENREPSPPSADQKPVLESNTPLENGVASSSVLPGDSSSILDGSDELKSNKEEEADKKESEKFDLTESDVSETKNHSDTNEFKEEDRQSKEVEVVEDNPLKWQLNLLDHIENIQQELDARLDDIGKRLEDLEAEYDYSDTNTATEVPRTKRLLNCIISDLLRVRRMCLYQ